MGVIMQAGHHNKRPRSVILCVLNFGTQSLALQRPQYSRAQSRLCARVTRGVQSFEVIAQSAPLIAHNSHWQRSFIN